MNECEEMEMNVLKKKRLILRYLKNCSYRSCWCWCCLSRLIVGTGTRTYANPSFIYIRMARAYEKKRNEPNRTPNDTIIQISNLFAKTTARNWWFLGYYNVWQTETNISWKEEWEAINPFFLNLYKGTNSMSIFGSNELRYGPILN